jgi:hypothetical protein
MANIILEKHEIEHLTRATRLKYEQGGRKLIVETKSKNNYVLLWKELDDIRKTRMKDASASTDQLMKLFTTNDDQVGFKDYFIDLCYMYAYGTNRNDYLLQQPIANQLVALKDVANRVLPIEREDESHRSELLLKEKEDLIQENEDLKQQLVESIRLKQEKDGLENDLKQTVHQIGVLNHRLTESAGVTQQVQKKTQYLQMAAIALIISLLGFAIYFWHWKERRHEELVWLNGHNLSNEDEGIYLKSKLPFITDSTSEFRQHVHTWVKLFIQGYRKLENPPSTKLSPDLINFRDLKSYEIDRNNKGYAIDNNKYYIDVATWRDPNQDTILNESRLLDSVNTLFGAYVNDLMVQKTKWQHLKIPDESFFESFFDVDASARYKPIFMFAVLKTDTTFGNASREIMVRYPPYDTKNVDAAGKTYHLQSRPWWRDATDVNRSKAFSWHETIEGQDVTMGLSRAYSSIRVDHRMQQRAFWIEIPVQKPSKFFLCIDFMMRID